MNELGFECSDADAGQYVRTHGRCFIFLWIDDLFIFCLSAEVKELVEAILSKFEGRDLGELE